MPFKKGQSGNPAGRPKGTGQAAKLRRAIADDIPDILDAMVKAAKSGDTAAAGLLLDRAIPKLKPEAQPVMVDMKRDTLAGRATAVLDAVADGQLDPDTAAALVNAVAKLARVVEISEIESRLAQLEAKRSD